MSELPLLDTAATPTAGPPPVPVQLSFLPEDPECQRELKGIYDASRLRASRPDIEHVIVEMLAQGQSIRAIKKVCRVHHYTIEAVAELNGIAIDTSRERVVKTLRLARQLLADTIVDELMEGRLKPEALGVTLGIVTEKLELLSGHATARIELARADGPKTWEEFFTAVRQKMGSGPEENGQMLEATDVVVHRLPAPAAPVVSPTDCSDPGRCDPASRCPQSGEAAMGAASVDPASTAASTSTAAPASDPPGGGSVCLARPPEVMTDP